MARRRHKKSHNGQSSPNSGNSSNETLSPAQRYARFQQVNSRRNSEAERFAKMQPFALDDFQIKAIDALEADNNVLVAAPTGAGKTIVADFAIHLAQRRNVKAFYTTPIKALSNQKYHDLVAVYGTDRVGLLTGDTSLNSEADIVVMTTEVLRNMLYERSTTLQALRYVILDEVHYLSDRFRGPVWEEVIIHLPPAVRIVALSATVSNVEDFSQWIASVRGKTKLVVSERRPVPLEQHVMVQADDRSEPELLNLYRQDGSALNAQLVNRLNQLDRQALRRAGGDREGSHRHHGRGNRSQPQRHTPRRWAVVDELDFLGLLPGIYFIFSRNGCDQAVDQCLNAGLELTTEQEARRIRQIVDEMVEGQLGAEDLKALHFSRFRYALEEGFAAHHAGMVALFRQIVERLFEEGLVKVVFATETLALGINMPARSVIIDKLEKFDGTGHVGLTPGEFTQLTGRAGRRGIDTIGHAIVVDHAGFVPATAAALSSKRVYPLHSSFHPTFNMAVNLLNSSDVRTARVTLDHSFAQWEANESAWQLESQMTTLRQALNGYEKAFACEHGDFAEFMDLRVQLTELERTERRRIKHTTFSTHEERSQALQDLDRRIAALREREQNHPCRSCPDLQNHLKWGHRWARERREYNRVKNRYETRTGSVARQFDRICGILHTLGYLKKHGDDDYLLTEAGQLLRRLYNERDIVIAQAIREGVFDGLKPSELAAVISSLVYEARRGGGGEPRRYPGGPQGAVALAAQALNDVFEQIDIMCQDAGLDEMSPLDFGIADTVYDWAEGEGLSRILRDTELTGGDFVRNAKRLVDVLQQIAGAEPYLGEEHSALAEVARSAAEQVDRGIVAYTGVE